MKKLEDLLRAKITIKDGDGRDKEVTPEFRVSVQKIDVNPSGVYFIIHPLGFSGTTLDFIVHGNNITEYEI